MKLFNLAIIRILEANHNYTTDLEKEKKSIGSVRRVNTLDSEKSDPIRA
jgi:hypothetical protein